MLYINTLNIEAKLLKYRLLLTSLIYYAALVLIPWNKWRYIKANLISLELLKAKTKVKALWDNDYTHLLVDSVLEGVSKVSFNEAVVSLIYYIYFRHRLIFI